MAHPATILAKIESRNPGYFVKCRVGAAMVSDAEKRVLFGTGKHIVKPISGNTGIALAFVAVARHPAYLDHARETMSIERRKLLVAYGADTGTHRGKQRHERCDSQSR